MNTVASRCRPRVRPTWRSIDHALLRAAGWPAGPPAAVGVRWAVSLTRLLLPCGSLRSRSAPTPDAGLRLQVQYPTPAPLIQVSGRLRPGARSGTRRGDGVLDRAAPRDEGRLVGAGRPFVAGLGVEVRADVGLCHAGQAGVGVRRDAQPAGEVEQVEVEHRKEALQVRLLVDGEVELARLDSGQRAAGGVNPAGRDLACQPDAGQRRAEKLGRAGVHRERALDLGLVADQV